MSSSTAHTRPRLFFGTYIVPEFDPYGYITHLILADFNGDTIGILKGMMVFDLVGNSIGEIRDGLFLAYDLYENYYDDEYTDDSGLTERDYHYMELLESEFTHDPIVPETAPVLASNVESVPTLVVSDSIVETPLVVTDTPPVVTETLPRPLTLTIPYDELQGLLDVFRRSLRKYSRSPNRKKVISLYKILNPPDPDPDQPSMYRYLSNWGSGLLGTGHPLLNSLLSFARSLGYRILKCDYAELLYVVHDSVPNPQSSLRGVMHNLVDLNVVLENVQRYNVTVTIL